MTETIAQELDDYVLTIRLNQPENRNALGPAMEVGLKSALQDAGSNPDVRVIVLTGAGDAFCVGADMGALKSLSDVGDLDIGIDASADSSGLGVNYRHRFTYMLDVPRPIIAAINGPIAGVGVSIAMFCDLRYMIETARLSTAFSRRGLVAEHGSSWMLPRLIGIMNANDLLMTGRKIDAAEAEKMGFARRLPADGFMRAVNDVARDMALNCSPRSTAIMKRQIYDGLFQNLDDATSHALDEEMKSFKTEDFKEGVAHFLEKRPPNFSGK